MLYSSSACRPPGLVQPGAGCPPVRPSSTVHPGNGGQAVALGLASLQNAGSMRPAFGFRKRQGPPPSYPRAMSSNVVSDLPDGQAASLSRPSEWRQSVLQLSCHLAPRTGSYDVLENICLWATMSTNLVPIESAICRQRLGTVFWADPFPVLRWLPTANGAPAKKAKGTEKRAGRVTLPSLFEDLREDGFFKKPKLLGEIKSKLADLGHNYPLTGLSGPMRTEVKNRRLRRFMEKKKYVYAQ
jgi:hypothetical protein